MNTHTSHHRMSLLLISALAMTMLLIACLTGCSQASTQDSGTDGTVQTVEDTSELFNSAFPETSVVGLKGPTGIALAQMMDVNEGNAQSPVSFNLVSAPDQATASLINGEADIAFLPTNLAATLFNRMDGGVQMAAITCLGNLYVVEVGNDIASIEDLRGQTIYATGQGANPQYILEHLLNQAGLVPGQDVTIEYLSEHAELATLVASGERSIAMLPEPYVSTVLAKNTDARIALNLNEVWADQNNGELTMGCAVVRTEYANAHPGAVAEFLSALHDSVDFTVSNVSETAELCVKYGIMTDQAIAEKAIPNCAITFIAGDSMKPAISDFFQVLYDANPNSIGGALPTDEFYWVS